MTLAILRVEKDDVPRSAAQDPSRCALLLALWASQLSTAPRPCSNPRQAVAVSRCAPSDWTREVRISHLARHDRAAIDRVSAAASPGARATLRTAAAFHTRSTAQRQRIEDRSRDLGRSRLAHCASGNSLRVASPRREAPARPNACLDALVERVGSEVGAAWPSDRARLRVEFGGSESLVGAGVLEYRAVHARVDLNVSGQPVVEGQAEYAAHLLIDAS